MALVALMALMLGSFAGLMIGRWAAVLPLALLTELDQQLKALRSDLQALAASLDPEGDRGGAHSRG